MSRTLLIDGYNLLHATDIFGEGRGADSFRHSREALLRFLSTSLNERERQNTTIVFDAADAPPNLPSEYRLDEIRVLFARNYPDADALIEQIIEEHHAPRGVLVVSSDHRVQRAARRRGSKSIDSEQWYGELWQRRVDLRRQQQRLVPEKPMGQLTAEEIEYWVNQFDVEANDEKLKKAIHDHDHHAKQSQNYDNPFPPGYGEDLLEGENL